MPFTKITGATNNLSKPSDWDTSRAGECGDLWVRIDKHGPYRQFNFGWKPDAHELELLNAGGEIEVHIVHDVMPPVGVSVVKQGGGPPVLSRKTITINEEGHGFDEHGPAYP